ncbi:MAG: lamin tail domain-containing protein [Myxococcales bacterium]|nr:lamin tail domain-containing protein [Myxococcales bacterium]
MSLVPLASLSHLTFLLLPASLCVLVGCSGKPADDTSGADSPVVTGDPPVAPTLVINEFLASNKAAIADSAGEYDDWVELYNNGETLISFTGLYLTDDLEAPEKSPLPTGSGLAPGDYLLIWCDGEPDQGDDHATFRINKAGGVVALYAASEGFDPLRVDGINYETQPADLSAARVPDGSDNWVAGQTPTPGGSNGSGS